MNFMIDLLYLEIFDIMYDYMSFDVSEILQLLFDFVWKGLQKIKFV